jgi:hypothetical protein
MKLSDQLMVLANQHHPLHVLKEQVDFVINDGPFLLSTAYYQTNYNLPEKVFKDLVIQMFKTYDNINIFINRNPEYAFEQTGRNESEQESMIIDSKIKGILIENNIKFIELQSSKNTHKDIFEILNLTQV